MIRKIIEIDKEKCNGCGLCAHACHEGAIGMVDGKAALLRDDYCDGLGNCLPVCPTGAISFVEREAAAYDEAAVQANMQAKSQPHTGCPGSMARSMEHAPVNQPASFIPLVGCPKLDDVDYSEKLTEILRQNNIKSVTVVRMEVPCCGGLEYAVRTALQNCGKLLPWQVKTISIKGELLDD